MIRQALRLIVVLMFCLLPVLAFAAGAHDSLECTGCHALHTAKDGSLIFAVEANKKDINPKTKQPYGGITALCLGCHDTPEKGGQGILPISQHTSHPYGLTSVNPKVARVPGELLRDGRFECIGCHDPHPSNTNYKYLRIDTANGSKMDVFCAVCHASKADPKAVSAAKARLFDSMDERNTSASAESGPAAAPAAKKKP